MANSASDNKKTNRYLERREVTVSLPIVKAPSWIQGFVNFVREQGVVGVAVGLILGIAAKSIVDSLVFNIFNPLIGLIGADGGRLDGKFYCLRETANGICQNKLGWGALLSDLLSFIIVALIVYFAVKGLKLDKFDKKKVKKTKK